MSELRIVKDGTVYEVEWWRAVRGTPVLAVVARDAEAVIYRTADGRVEKVTRYLTRENGEDAITRLSRMVAERNAVQVWPRALFSEPRAPETVAVPEPEVPEIDPFSVGWDIVAYGEVEERTAGKFQLPVLYRRDGKLRHGWIFPRGDKDSTSADAYQAQLRFIALSHHEQTTFVETFPGGPLSVSALQWYRIEELAEKRTSEQWLDPEQFPSDRFHMLSYDDVRLDKAGEQWRRVILRDPRNRCVRVTLKPDGRHTVREINAMTARADFRKMAHRSMPFTTAFPNTKLRSFEMAWILANEHAKDGTR